MRTIQKLRSVLDQKIDTKSLVAEINTLHKKRSLPNRKSSNSIAESVLKDQSYRSRIVSIKSSALTIRSKLAFAYDAALKHTILNTPMLQKTKTDKIMVIENEAKEILKYMAELKDVIDSADLVLEDIDKAHYAYKFLLSALELQTRREYTT
jgi:hypothetical protein